MRAIPILIILLALANQQCGNKNILNQFSASDDTLLIRTEKRKGNGLFSLGVMPVNFEDSVEKTMNPAVFPKEVTGIKRLQILTDLKSKEPHYVDIMRGMMNGNDIFIVDEDNNKDFSNDSIRVFKAINWESINDLIKCKFLISNGHEIIEDSSWIRIGILQNDIWCGRSEHLIADFTINKEKYSVGIIDSRLFGFFYGIYPEAALISNNSVTKDTLLQKDIVKIGEYLNFNGIYYRFENVSNNGEFITLIKEKSFIKKIGTQVGMIAPDFICKTVSGDTIESSALHDRLIIITNSCGCGGDSQSTKAYYDIRKEYETNVHVFRLDSNIEKGSDGLQIDISEKFNEDFYKNFRNEYCSRTCYVIDANNRIIDKFSISNWRSNMPRHIKKNKKA